MIHVLERRRSKNHDGKNRNQNKNTTGVLPLETPTVRVPQCVSACMAVGLPGAEFIALRDCAGFGVENFERRGTTQVHASEMQYKGCLCALSSEEALFLSSQTSDLA